MNRKTDSIHILNIIYCIDNSCAGIHVHSQQDVLNNSKLVKLIQLI